MSSDHSINLDEIIVGGLDPRTWYVFVQAQVELLRCHVQEREKQIDESVKATPAMEAGISTKLWSIEDIVKLLD